jgi:hypothetical protein
MVEFEGIFNLSWFGTFTYLGWVAYLYCNGRSPFEKACPHKVLRL